jgi:RNA polymerase sigma factor (sigma-70 family)
MHFDFVTNLSPVSYGASQSPDGEIFYHLDRELRPRMIASLKSRGASRELAEDLVSEVLAECVPDSPRNLLARFRGTGPVDGWLLRVAINRLISRQRRERLMSPIGMEAIESMPCEDPQEMEGALQGMVSKALREALDLLPAQWRLLLWLRHGYEIPQKRLCICWQSTPSRLSRALSSARDAVREHTLRSLQKEEPDLNLQWQDISGVCADSDFFNHISHVA